MNPLGLTRRVTALAERNPLDVLRLTAWQLEYVQLEDQFALLRAGNQLGKTTIKLWELIHLCRGTHPFRRPFKPPINVLALSESMEMMRRAGGYMEKLWNLLPKDEIDPRISFRPGYGLAGAKYPAIAFVRGPGKGSVISFGTYRQGSAPFAGSTVHLVDCDEPPPQLMLDELMPRLLRHRGQMRVGFTPVINMPDQRHLRKLVEGDDFVERNPSLTEEACWPIGAAVPWNWQWEIDKWARLMPEPVRAMRINGSWDPVLDDAWLANFDRKRHVRRVTPPTGSYLAVGIDHGTQAGKQAAALIAAVDRDRLDPYVAVLDEEVSDATTTPSQDARNILDMLERNGYTWRDVDEWIGDRPTKETRYLVKKSNELLRRHLAAEVGIKHGMFPRILTPRKFWGSVEHGLHLMNALYGNFDDDGTPHMTVDPDAPGFAKFCETFAGDRHDPLKDIGDAVRYAIERAIKTLPSMQLVAKY